MQNILEVNREEMWARVQPGVVQDELNAHVRPLGLLFGPDTSTSNRATIGGMLGNNSGGSHSIAYGLTIEHVIELTASSPTAAASSSAKSPRKPSAPSSAPRGSKDRSTARSRASATSTGRSSGSAIPSTGGACAATTSTSW